MLAFEHRLFSRCASSLLDRRTSPSGERCAIFARLKKNRDGEGGGGGGKLPRLTWEFMSEGRVMPLLPGTSRGASEITSRARDPRRGVRFSPRVTTTVRRVRRKSCRHSMSASGIVGVTRVLDPSYDALSRNALAKIINDHYVPSCASGSEEKLVRE